MTTFTLAAHKQNPINQMVTSWPPLVVLCVILSSAAEAETEGLFTNMKEGTVI